MPFLLSRTQFLARPSRAEPGQCREEMGEGDYGPEGPEWRQRGFEGCVDARKRRAAAVAVMLWAHLLEVEPTPHWHDSPFYNLFAFVVSLLLFFFNPFPPIFSRCLSLGCLAFPPRSTDSENTTRGVRRKTEREREEKKWTSGERKGGRKEGRS